jgi:hypothetical protein
LLLEKEPDLLSDSMLYNYYSVSGQLLPGL